VSDDPQAKLLDTYSVDALLDVLGPAQPAPFGTEGPPAKTGRLLATRSGEEIVADETLAGDIEWLADGFFPFGGLSIVYGLPKSGKTTLVMHLAARVVTSKLFLERATRCCNVLWLDLEQHIKLTRRKIEFEGAVGGKRQVFAYNGAPPLLVDVEETLLHHNTQVVVVDSLSSLLMLEDENDNAEITRRIARWRELAHRHNLAFIAIHHSRKSEGTFGVGMRGGNAILGISDVALEVKRLHSEHEEDDGRRKLVSVSRYDEANDTGVVQRVGNDYEVEPTALEHKQDTVLRLLKVGPRTEREVTRNLGIARRKSSEVIASLIAGGHIQRSGTGKRGDPIVYSL